MFSRALLIAVFSLVPAMAQAAPDPKAEAAQKNELEETVEAESGQRFLHGFRLGYLVVMNSDTVADPDSGSKETLAQKYDMKSPHHFVIGYEAAWRIVGHDWLNVLVVANAMIAGLEQSRFFPSLNTMLGFEIAETMQFGVGISAVPTDLKPAHMLIAAGWTPKIGDIYTPIHAFFIPDVDGQHRTGLTVGVNW